MCICIKGPDWWDGLDGSDLYIDIVGVEKEVEMLQIFVVNTPCLKGNLIYFVVFSTFFHKGEYFRKDFFFFFFYSFIFLAQLSESSG